MSTYPASTDPQFLAALQDCRSLPFRALAIRLDTLAAFLRLDGIEPAAAADCLNELGFRLLSLAVEKLREAAV